jgi:signal transduction histidine kinase
VTIPTVLGEERRAEFAWDFGRLPIAQRALLLAAFGLLYSLSVIAGHGLRENSEELTILWPAAGLLYVALLVSKRRIWPLILAVQMTVEIAVDVVRTDQFGWHWYLPLAVANSLGGVVGVLVIQRVATYAKLPNFRTVLQFFGAVALGAAASATLGAFGSAGTLSGVHYLREWQLWWAGSGLGCLMIAPCVLSWAVRRHAPRFTAPPPPRVEVALIGCTLLGMTVWVFSAPPGSLTTILDPPFLLLALVLVSAYRMPPRWSTTFAAAIAAVASYLASRGLGPFAGDANPFVRVGAVQLYLATLVAINFILTTVLFEMRTTLRLLRRSRERYRNFVEHSSEAVWRMELDTPMDIGLPVNEQIAWLREYAYVAEGNETYLRLSRQNGIPEANARLGRAELPWTASFLEYLETAAQRDYAADGLQFTFSTGSRQLTFITGFRGVIEAGKLVRIWGVARDVTELTELNDRLRQKQDRLQAFARQLTGAEDRARRATAVDLHDGIGQQLVGLTMTLDAAAGRATPEVRLLLGEAIHTAREVQAITQRVIADLSPPGLYELGLEPALKWLSVYMRGKDNLQVDLNVAADDREFDLDLRVLVFKLIRELLRNVVKHSGVRSAAVTVTRMPHELRVVVEDHGVGFEWQLSLFESHAEGFGLRSVADRVRAAAGEMTVDTAPGRGCRVSVLFPLGAGRLPAQRPDSRGELRAPDHDRSAADG